MTDPAAQNRAIAELHRLLTERLDAIFQDPDSESIHMVRVSRREVRCLAGCPGPGPHLKEYRAARVQPTTEQTMAYRARDAVPPPAG